MSLPPSEIPLGAMRFNSDSQKLEYWNGSAWFQIQTFSPNLNGGTRGIYAIGTQPGGDTNTIQFITISTAGDAVDFGDSNYGQSTSEVLGGVASNTRGVFAGGYLNPAHINTMEYVTIAQQGNGTDFGDLVDGGHGGQGLSNQTRGIFAIGNNEPGFNATNRMDYITIASTGNAKDFGDTITTSSNGACASPTRGVLFGGSTSPEGSSNIIQFITIATLGDAQDFGDLPTIHNHPTAAGNSIRGLSIAGSAPSPAGDVNTIEYITIATGGNGQDFGDITQTVRSVNATSDPTRVVRMGGYSDTNVMDYVQIATTGDAIDFGDLINITRGGAAFSNGQGGLG